MILVTFRKSLCVPLALLFVLAACTPSEWADANQVPGKISYARGFDQSRVLHSRVIELRIARPNPENKRALIDAAGADCTLSGKEFTIHAMSPQLIHVPVIRGEIGNYRLSCKYGDRTYQQTILARPYFELKDAPEGGGLLFSIVAMGVTDVRNAKRAKEAQERGEWSLVYKNQSSIFVNLSKMTVAQ